MFNRFRNRVFASVIYFITLSATAITFPFQAQAQVQLNCNEALLIYKVKKIVGKLLKAKNKTPKQMMGYVLKVQKEVQNAMGFKVNMNDYLDVTLKLIKQQTGKSLNKVYLPSLKKGLKTKGREIEDIELYPELDFSDPFSEEDCHLWIANAMNGKDVNGQEIGDLPPSVSWGITLTLCGVFLQATQFPPFILIGKALIATGMGMCIQTISGKADEDYKKDKEKKGLEEIDKPPHRPGYKPIEIPLIWV